MFGFEKYLLSTIGKNEEWRTERGMADRNINDGKKEHRRAMTDRKRNDGQKEEWRIETPMMEKRAHKNNDRQKEQ